MKKPTLIEMTEEQKTAIKASYWNAPPEADFEQETVAIVYGWSIAWLQAKRSHGGGPIFRKVGRKILYTKRDVVLFFDRPKVGSTSEYEKAA
jgi:hypothetical protein